MSEAEQHPPTRRDARVHRETVAEQARRRGIEPVTSVEDMARDDVFETDEELEAFLAHVNAERHANLT